MTNPIDLDALNPLKSPATASAAAADPQAFLKALQDSSAAVGVSVAVTASATASAVSPQDMTLDEYKRYIHDKISNMPIHPSQEPAHYSVQITDAGFEAMQNDPEYEKWVLDEALGTNFSSRDPWAPLCGGVYRCIHIGATVEESYGSSWHEGFHRLKGKDIWDDFNQDSFWTNRDAKAQAAASADRRAQAREELERMWREEAIDLKRAYQDYLDSTGLFAARQTDDSDDLLVSIVNDKAFSLLAPYGVGANPGGFVF